MKRSKVGSILFWVALVAVWAVMVWAFVHFIVEPTQGGALGESRALAFPWEGRDVEILQPLWLGIVLVTPVLWAVRRFTLSDLPTGQQWLSALVRALVIAALALGLSRVVFTSFESRVTTVFLVDVSASMPDEALEEARGLVEEAYLARGPRNDVRLVTFAKEAQVVELAATAERLPPLARPADEDALLGTDIQSAMRLAYGLFPQDHVKRIVLISDGNQTDGDLLAETYNARDYGIKVFARSFRFEPRPEALVKDLVFPDEVKVGAPFDLVAEIYSTKPAQAKLVLWQNEFRDGEQSVSLEPGLNTITFKTQVYEQGVRRYKLNMTLEGGAAVDTFQPNNAYEEKIEVTGKPKVLLLEGERNKVSYLERALQRSDIDVERRDPAGMPNKLSEYENFDAVIMSDVQAQFVTTGKMQVLDNYVRQVGGGFIMVGGENSFGPGGYYNTYMENILPVTFDGEKSRDTPSLALMLVIDRSSSMRGQKLELAKEAARETVNIMGKDDKVGVIAFDASPDALVPLQSAANKTRIRSDIARMQPSGGTNIAPALQQAVLELAQTRAALKHIILLTDGASPPGNIFTELATLMQVERITCSTVAVGREADRGLLKRIADAGSGRAYFTADPYSIPRIFTKETSSVARTQMVEEPFKVRVARQSQSIRGIDFASAPYLLGYVSTKARPQAEVILVSPYGEPIYARWRRGLGKSAVFTTDAKNRWAVQWVGWPGFSKLWSQIVRDLMRTNEERTFPMQLAVEGGQGRITVDAYDEATGGTSYINSLLSKAAVQPPEGDKLEIDLQQIAPGRYEARFPLTSYGSYSVSVDHADAEGDSLATSKGTLTWPYPDEYLKLEPNTALIQKAVEIGRGGLDPTAARLFDPEGESVKFKSELWPYFLFGALGLFVLDLLLRRLRFYGKTAVAWEKVAGRG